MNRFLLRIVERYLGPKVSATFVGSLFATLTINKSQLDAAIGQVQDAWTTGGPLQALQVIIGLILVWYVYLARKADPKAPIEEGETPEVQPLRVQPPQTRPAPNSVDIDLGKSFFTDEEFECQGQTCNCAFPGMHAQLMTMLHDVRSRFGVTIIKSGYRCPQYNADVGGEKESFHLTGQAADIRCPSVSVGELYDYLDSKYRYRYGIGRYERFVHLDCRPGYARKTAPTTEWFWQQPDQT